VLHRQILWSITVAQGNSLLRGPQDLVGNIFNTISPGSTTGPLTFPCTDAHTLEFEIGGQRFPIDPRDFVGTQTGSAKTCDTSRLVVTDDPSKNGQLFSWSLGDPFMKVRAHLCHKRRIDLTSVRVEQPRGLLLWQPLASVRGPTPHRVPVDRPERRERTPPAGRQ
jgi:hypothetical protein